MTHSLRPSRIALATALTLTPLACGDDTTPSPAAKTPRFGESTTEELVAAMTLEEKVEQMHGASLAAVNELWETPSNDRLGIPGFRMTDGPRGVRAGKSTAFPVAAARAATWDPELEREVGRAIGREASAKGADVLLAPTVNILRHPAWGRAQETYGEDTMLMGAMGTAFTLGAQESVLACVKHFAANSIEDTRFDVDVSIDERSLREIYLPHFERIVHEGGAACVMSAYNKVNGAFASENAHLLRDILKNEWAFSGIVISDWVFGTRSTVPAVLAGLDIEMPAPNFFGAPVAAAVESGEVPAALVDDAVTRILDKQLEAQSKPPVDGAVIESAEHKELARKVAQRSMVLLKNDASTLPLDPNATGTIAVVGPLATVARLGDLGSSAVTPTTAVTPFDGIAARADQTVHIAGPTLAPADELQLQSAVAAIVVVGLDEDDEGEAIAQKGGDRETLRLSAEDEAMIAAVAAVAPRTIVVLEAGSSIVVRPWVDQVDALVMAWYPGLEGGHAIADVVFGDADPGGRLPVTFPRDEAGLPPFDHESFSVTYGFLHGYRYLDAALTEPEYPFGFGLSYTTFSLTNLQVTQTSTANGGVIAATVDVTNTGARSGSTVVQVYVHPAASAVERAPRDLRGFARVELSPGATSTVPIEIPIESLAYFDTASNAFVVEPGSYVIEAGSSSRDLPLTATITIAN